MTERAWISVAAAVGAGLALSACASLRPQPPASAAAPPPMVAPAAPAPAPAKPAPPGVRTMSCIAKSLPRAPKYPDTAEALRDAGGAADRYQLMAAGRILREKRLAELERAVDACR